MKKGRTQNTEIEIEINDPHLIKPGEHSVNAVVKRSPTEVPAVHLLLYVIYFNLLSHAIYNDSLYIGVVLPS